MKKLIALMLLLSGCGLQRQIDDLNDRAARQFDQVDARIAELRNELNTQIDMLMRLSITNELEREENLATIINIQGQINAMLIRLAILEGFAIIDIVDPCGGQGSYNEVLLKLSSGQYLASFSDNSSGKNTRFVTLTDGNYITTDGTRCQFNISGSQVSW